jgi:hypothetical protein
MVLHDLRGIGPHVVMLGAASPIPTSVCYVTQGEFSNPVS